MYGWLSRAGDGATHVVTASRRLARVLSNEYNVAQVEAGRLAWRTPVILSYSDWLAKLYASVQDDRDATRINAQQSRILWERVLRPYVRDPLINIGNLCRDAREAWQRIHEWRVPLPDIADAARGVDQRIFAKAAADYQALLDANRWIDDATLAGKLITAIDSDALVLPQAAAFAGFDRLTPVTGQLLDRLRERGVSTEIVDTPAARRSGLMPYESVDAELRAAGAWAHAELLQDPSRRVAIVVSGLEQDAKRAGRFVREGFVPGWQYAGGAHAASVNVSLGDRLTSYPAIEVALLVLAWTCRELDGHEISILLRSPYLGLYPAPGRSRIELQLRDMPDRSWSLGQHLRASREESTDSKDWLARWSRLADLRNEQPRMAAPSFWAQFANAVLDTVNWPGEHALNSADFQLVDRWRDLLNELARLELVVPEMSMSEAFAQLSAMAGESVFQPEVTGGVVQVMGPLEAAGMSFDRLWISGLTANQWPPPGRTLALVSRNLQRERGMPNAEPEDTIAYAERVLTRLIGSAETCVCSYAQSSGDSLQAPAALLDDLTLVPPLPDPGWQASTLIGQGNSRRVVNDPVPAVTESEKVRGGAGTLQWQVNEPFSAFAYGRLGIRRLQSFVPGLTPLLRGNLVHAALHYLYEDLPTQDSIYAWNEDSLNQKVAAAIDRAFSDYERQVDHVLVKLLRLERARVTRLLRDVVENDKQRQSFRVDAVEEQRDFACAGLALQLRIDRIDRYDDDSIAILDYKTGTTRRFLDASGDPRDFQVIVYAIAVSDSVSTLGIYNVDSRQTGLDASRRSAFDADDWDAQIRRWSDTVVRAATNFVSGDVRINAARSSVDARPLSLLSRIGELKRDA
jgi:probable DNA repair protein